MLPAPDGSTPWHGGDELGYSVAIDGDTAVVGVPGDSPTLSNSGTAFVFVSSQGTWQLQQILSASDASVGDKFGTSVSISGDTIVVGADDSGQPGSTAKGGAAYVFARAGATWNQQQKLVASDAATADEFGVSAAISGGTIVIGAFLDDVSSTTDCGSAYVFVRSGSTWAQQQKLTASDRAAGDRFGVSVGIDGDSVVVGAYLDDTGTFTNSGSAYVFIRSGTAWSQQQKLTAADATSNYDFGISVAIRNDTVVVGAELEDTGAAYVYTRTGTSWALQQKLIASDEGSGDAFGASVSISDDTVVVGTKVNSNVDVGAAYVFVRNGTSWTQQQKIASSEPGSDDQFGSAVAVSGDTAIIGAPLDDTAFGPDAGTAHVYTRTLNQWGDESNLYSTTDNLRGMNFGNSVAIDGDTAVVGASNNLKNGIGAGAAYVYAETDQGWVEQQELLPPDPGPYERFGSHVAISGGTIVITSFYNGPNGLADTGSAYVFTESGGLWSLKQKLTASDGAVGDLFGSAVSINDDTIVVGAEFDDNGAKTNAGSAYVFERSAGVWTQQQTIVPADEASGDEFGATAAISGGTIIVGSPFNDSGVGADSGAAYIYVDNGSGWALQQKLIDPPRTTGDDFGLGVAIDGNTAVIGAPSINTVTLAGSAYVFVRNGATWSQQQKLAPSDPVATDQFGYAVAVKDDRVVVGSYDHDVGSIQDAGAAYEYLRSGTTWTQQPELNALAPAALDQFGVAVALTPGGILVGSINDDTSLGADSGSAYVFQIYSTATTAVDAGGAYTGFPFPATVTVMGGGTMAGTVSIAYFNTDMNVSLGSVAPTAPGHYTVTATYPSDATHTGSTSGPISFAIAKATSTTTVVDPGGVYDGTKTFAATSAKTVGAGGLNDTNLSHFTFTYLGTGFTSYGPSSLAPSNAGTYSVTASYAGDANHFGSASDPPTFFTVNQVGSESTVTLASEFVNGLVTFDGSPHGASAIWTSTGTDGEHGPLAVTYTGILGTAYGPTITPPANSGHYEASANFADANHTSSSNTADFTINRVSATSTETFVVTSVALQPSANLALDNDFTRFANAFADIRAGDTVQINGTLDWNEPNALASWKATGEAFAMPHLDGITVDAASPGDGVNGPGDDPSFSGEGPFYFDGLGTDKGWNITGLTISNFDTAFFYSPESDVTDYSGTHLTNNTITVPNANPGAQNGGILLGPSPNQTIQGNTIDITGNGGATAASFGISSFTYNGNGAWNNLLLDNNSINVMTAGANQKIIGIAENSGSIASNITVTNNTFNGDSGSLPSNQQVAFGITSQATSTAAVIYTGNKVNGAKDGFVWGDPEGSPAYDFTAAQYVPIAFSNTTLTNVGTGFVARDGGKATISSTTITNNAAFNFGTAFAADRTGTVITVTDSVSNFTGVSALKNETNGGLVIFLNNIASIQNVSKAEGNSGFTLFSFPVMLAVALSANQTFTVDYSTASGTADGNDYNTASGTLTFGPGQSSATIAVKVLGDFNPEPDETFFVNLSNPILTTNGSPAPGHLTNTQAIGTIQNDDSTTIAASIASATATKSATMGSQTLMTFATTLNSAPPAGEYLTVNYHASNGTAHSGADYSAPDGTLTFLAGSTTPVSSLTVTVIGSPATNPPETFTVTLDTPLLHFTGFAQSIPGNIGSGTATGTLDSPPPSGAVVSVNSVSKPEGTPIPGNSASNFTTFTFTISYTGTLTSSIKVNWATGNGSALGGQDYQQNSGQVTLTPTVTSQTFSVTVFADKTVEPNETFSVNLTNPGLNGFSNYTFGTSTGIGTILNDD